MNKTEFMNEVGCVIPILEQIEREAQDSELDIYELDMAIRNLLQIVDGDDF